MNIDDLDKEIADLIASAMDGDTFDSNEFKAMFESIQATEVLSPEKSFVVKLSKKQKNFINLSGQVGPNDESFFDPIWEHCHNEDCDLCSQ